MGGTSENWSKVMNRSRSIVSPDTVGPACNMYRYKFMKSLNDFADRCQKYADRKRHCTKSFSGGGHDSPEAIDALKNGELVLQLRSPESWPSLIEMTLIHVFP